MIAQQTTNVKPSAWLDSPAASFDRKEAPTSETALRRGWARMDSPRPSRDLPRPMMDREAFALSLLEPALTIALCKFTITNSHTVDGF